MANYTRNMNQTATYWARTGSNIFNEPTFAAPVAVTCRWENKGVLFRDQEGRELISNAVIYPVIPLARQGWLFNGTSAASDPRTVAGASEIREAQSSPNLSNTLTLNKVYL